jgi:hypothetical protein
MVIYILKKLLGYYAPKAVQAVRLINNNDLYVVILSWNVLFDLVQLFDV